jgi:hypothetical protein
MSQPRLYQLAALTLAFLAAPALAQEREDLGGALEGEWEVVEMIFKGKVQEFGGEPERMKFSGGKHWLTFKEHGKYTYPDFLGNAYVILPGGQIDIKCRFGLIKALYRIKDDKLRIIWQEYADERPTDFDTAADPRLTLRVLKRVAK